MVVPSSRGRLLCAPGFRLGFLIGAISGAAVVSGVVVVVLVTSVSLITCDRGSAIAGVVDKPSAVGARDNMPFSSSSSSPSGAPQRGVNGWHVINVYFGDSKLFVDNRKISDKDWKDGYPSQVNQDKLILDLIGKTNGGYFVDLAANDALEFSNTYALEQHGWDGLCIEPNPAYWYGLSNRKCHVVGALVGGSDLFQEVTVSFRGVFGGIIGKYDNKLADRKKEPQRVPEKRYAVPIVEILEMYQVPKQIDYLSLDVEGSEYFVLSSFPFDKYKILLLTIEKPDRQLKALLESNGYVFLKRLAWWGETLWAHESMGYTPKHSKIASIQEQ